MFVLRSMVALALTFSAGIASAEAPWGGTEIGQASHAALAALEEAEGAAAFAAVTGVTVERTAQGISAKAKVTYKQGTTNVTKSYFCHRHDGEVDCH